jgi:hypothetical protein
MGHREDAGVPSTAHLQVTRAYTVQPAAGPPARA